MVEATLLPTAPQPQTNQAVAVEKSSREQNWWSSRFESPWALGFTSSTFLSDFSSQ